MVKQSIEEASMGEGEGDSCVNTASQQDGDTGEEGHHHQSKEDVLENKVIEESGLEGGLEGLYSGGLEDTAVESSSTEESRGVATDAAMEYGTGMDQVMSEEVLLPQKSEAMEDVGSMVCPADYQASGTAHTAQDMEQNQLAEGCQDIV